MFSRKPPQHEFMKDSRFRKMKPHFVFNDLSDYGQDFGRMVSSHPVGVFMPSTVEMLQLFLKIASDYKIKITCRGRGNSAFGQSQVDGGVVIDLSKMDIGIEYPSDDYSSVTVPAFRTWQELTNDTIKHGKTVPVTVDNLDLTVGGTLSFAALGGTSYRCGSGADNVLSLEVLTLAGERLHCSEDENSELFNAVLSGMGQYGIMISATIPLVTMKQQVTMYNISYREMEAFLSDQKRLFDLQVFDHLKGFVRKKDDQWEYVIEAATYYDEQEDVNVSRALTQLSGDKTQQVMLYPEFINLVTGFVKLLRDAGMLDAPHPWYNILMPEGGIKEHLEKVLCVPYLTGAEPIIIYPMNREHFKRPLFMKPASETFYLLGVLYNTSFVASKDFPYQEVLDLNKALYLEAKENGGCRYAVDAIHFSEDDWAKHFEGQWDHVCALKHKHDSDHLLSTGVNIFDQADTAASRFTL